MGSELVGVHIKCMLSGKLLSPNVRQSWAGQPLQSQLNPKVSEHQIQKLENTVTTHGRQLRICSGRHTQ